MAQEKRKDKRVKEDFSILFKIFRKTELDGNVSRLIDISKSGASFVTDTQLTKNDILHLIFRIPPDFKNKAELFGRVIDSQAENSGSFKTRVAFIDIDSNARTILSRIIEQTNKGN